MYSCSLSCNFTVVLLKVECTFLALNFSSVTCFTLASGMCEVMMQVGALRALVQQTRFSLLLLLLPWGEHVVASQLVWGRGWETCGVEPTHRYTVTRAASLLQPEAEILCWGLSKPQLSDSQTWESKWSMSHRVLYDNSYKFRLQSKSFPNSFFYFDNKRQQSLITHLK